MRGFDIAVTTFALRASATKPPEHEQLLAPALDGPGSALLDRSTISHQHAALVASLWPEPMRQCVARPHYDAQPAPAMLGRVHAVSWSDAPGDARALQTRLERIFAASKEHFAVTPAHAA